MKIGSIMENQKKAVCTTPEGPVFKDTNRNVKLAVAAVTVTVVALVVGGAIAFSAVYIGGRNSNDAITKSYVFTTTAGQVVDETITVTNQEEEIGLNHGTRVIYDFNQGIVVMKVSEDGEHICFFTTFDRNKIHLPSEGELYSMVRCLSCAV